MKLIVTIPAYNEEATIAEVIKEIPRQIAGIERVEVLVFNDGSTDNTVAVSQQAGADYVISHSINKGLAITFKHLIEAALKRGADIIVNTDADNHYNQSRIPDLIQPIQRKQADIVIGGRDVKELKKMPRINKYGNLIGSYITSKIAGLPSKFDVSTGFRAYTREAALRLNLYSHHTYVHATLVDAADQRLTILEIPIKARPVQRKSRLIKSIPRHIINASIVILRNIILFKPLRFFGLLGAGIFLIGVVFVIRFLYYYFTSGGQGHIQSLVLAGVLIIVGFQVVVMGFIASAIGWNRKNLEEVLYYLRKQEYKK